MKVFFVWSENCALADPESAILRRIREVLLFRKIVKEVMSVDAADVVLLEERPSFKNFRYIDKLINDPFLSGNFAKVFTVNTDDCATGLLRGLYTSIPRSRFDNLLHRAIPFLRYPNERIFSAHSDDRVPKYLASWRGNTKSNLFRKKMISTLAPEPDIRLETTGSWLDHRSDEKETYLELMLNTKFSLCPAGWAPVSFRIYESMALARCPVILADAFVPPPGPDWNNFALFFPQGKISGLKSFLVEHEPRYDALGEKAREAWEAFFAFDKLPDYFADALLDLLNRSPRSSGTLELQRWQSLALHWSNHWTLPQRLMNKARRWSRELIH